MSRFSGKCDFYDEIEIFGLENILKSKVFVGPSKEPLKLTSRRDCIPYYPYVVMASYYNDGVGCLFLTAKSWVDIEEERYGKSHPLFDIYREMLKEELELFDKNQN
jgi:hypothetical protein